MRGWTKAAAAVVMAAVLAGACGGGDDGEAAVDDVTTSSAVPVPADEQRVSSAKKGCEYLAKADVDAATGTTTKEPTDSSTDAVGICNYQSESPVFLVGTRIEHQGASHFDATNATTEQVAKVKPQPEPGIGERASWYFRGISGIKQSQLTVAAGARLITVTITAQELDEAKAKSISKTLAQKIIDAA